MKKCKVCGKLFRLKKENMYLVETVVQNAIFKAFEVTKVYECFDCPACDCQNVCNVREVNGRKYDESLDGILKENARLSVEME